LRASLSLPFRHLQTHPPPLPPPFPPHHLSS
jgi:hypothetical protein